MLLQEQSMTNDGLSQKCKLILHFKISLFIERFKISLCLLFNKVKKKGETKQQCDDLNRCKMAFGQIQYTFIFKIISKLEI